jgi:hypothetical protein
MIRARHAFRLCAMWVAALIGMSLHATAQNCETANDLDDATRSAITATAQRYFDSAAKGDTESLKQNAIPSLAASFSAVETTIKAHQADLAGAQTKMSSLFLLQVEGSAPLPRAEFYCGVFGKNGQTPGSAIFELNNLPPGKYGVVLLQANSQKAATSFSEILQQEGNDWKLGGLYLRAAQISGHDGEWFAARARDYKAKGQLHNAWFYYLEARNLTSPLPFMATQVTDKLYDEFQNVRPADVPADGKTADLAAGAATYKLTTIFPDVVGTDLDLIVKYQVADISNTNQTYQDNMGVIKALVAKYPELKDAFTAVVARAVAPSGQDYGTLLAMKDVK